MRKIFLFVTAALCSVTMAFAQEDTRTVISTCAFTGTPASVVAGQNWYEKWATSGGCFKPVTSNIYHVSQYMYLQKKQDDNSWASFPNNTIITEGTYRYNLQLRIDSDYGAGTSYRLQDDGTLTMTVDGVSWSIGAAGVTTMPTFSYVWVFGPEMTVEKVTLPLKFTYNSSLDYKVNYINQAITEKDLKQYTTGGTESYTYTKTTNKAPWFQVSEDGILSGTPTALSQQAVRDSVKLSDGEKDTIIALYVGPVAPLPANREVVSSASFTNFTTPKIGDVNSTSYRSTLLSAIVRPEGAVYQLTDASNTRFYKVVNDQTVLMADGEAFAEGTYRMQGQIRIDDNNGYFYVLDSENDLTATMDGKAMNISSGSTQDTYSYRFYSHEFTIVGLADGYYLAGSFNNWEPSEDDMLVANTSEQARQGEMVIKGVTLSLNDEFKIGRAENGVIPSDNDHWYGSGQGNNNFVVTADFVGVKDIYFVPTWQNDWNGHIYVATPAPATVSLTQFLEDKPTTEVTLSDLTVIFAAPSGTKSNTYVIDEDGVALMMYDANQSFYDGTLTAGKVLSGQKATYATYKNQDEIIPKNTVTATDGVAPVPTLLTEAPTDANINRFIRFENVAAAKASNNNYYIFSNVQLYGATSSLKPSEDGNYNVEGLYIKYNGTSPELIVTGIEKVVGSAVENAAAEIKTIKRIENGQLFIIRDGKTFNAQGAEVR